MQACKNDQESDRKEKKQHKKENYSLSTDLINRITSGEIVNGYINSETENFVFRKKKKKGKVENDVNTKDVQVYDEIDFIEKKKELKNRNKYGSSIATKWNHGVVNEIHHADENISPKVSTYSLLLIF